MPKPYSDDLRQRAITKIENGLSRRKTANQLEVAVSTVQKWWMRYKEKGNFSAISAYRKGHSHKITNLDKFRKFVDKNSDLTSDELAKTWGNISQTRICVYLKKIGYSRKKNISLQREK